MSLRTARLLAGLAALGVVVAGVGPARADDPAGTVTLASGPSAYDVAYAPLAHTSRGTVFASSGGAVMVTDAGSPSTFDLASSYSTSACTDTVISAYPVDDEPFQWTDVSTGHTGTAKVTSGRFLLGATPDGWLETDDTTDGSTAVTEVHRRYTGSATDTLLATIPDPTDPTSSPFLSSMAYTCDASGYAVTAYTAAGTSIIVGSFAGGYSRLVDDSSAQDDLYPAAISGQTVVYGQDTSDGLNIVSSTTFRKTVGGSATVLDTSGTVTAAAIGTTSTAFAVASLTDDTVTLRIRSNAGTTSTPTQPAGWSPWLAWPSGSGFEIASYGSSGGGVYAAATTSSVTSVWVPSGGSLSTSAISQSAGRAVWADDRQRTSPVWSRPVTGTTVLTAGQEVRVGTGAVTLGGDLLADGTRTVWSDAGDGRLQVSDGTAVSEVAVAGSPAAVSGHRVLVVPGEAGSSTNIVDLVTGLVSPAGNATVLWGERTAGVDPATGSIVVASASTGATTATLAPADVGVPDGGVFGDLALEGDLLAWTWVDEGDTSTTFGLGWKNLATGAVTQAQVADPTLPLEGPSVFGGLVAVDDVTEADVYDASDGTLVTDVPGADQAGIGPVGLTYVDHTTREPKVAPLANQHLVPQHEGNPVAPTTFALSSGPWTGQWVFTQPLSTCAVTVTDDADTPVATLPCDATDAAYGEAVATWDGTATAGGAVAPGTYHWTLHAADADGPAVDVDGSATTLSGSIAVTAVPPAYTPLTPSRILDTRTGVGARKGLVPSGGSVTVQVTGHGAVPAGGVDAVVLNVTATNETGTGYVTTYPAGTTQPSASSLNYSTNRAIANEVVAKPSADGRVTLYASTATHLVADVAGYYPTGAAFTSLSPTRILDTRTGLGAPAAKVGAGRAVSLTAAGTGGVPADAAAVVLNVTVTQPSAPGFVTAYPGGATRPNASTINYGTAQTIAGMVIAKIGTGDKVNLYTSASAHLVADVVGWIPAGADYHPLTPARLLDTRVGNGAPRAVVRAGHAVTVKVTGRGGVPTGATTVMLTVAAVGPASSGYVTVYPSGVSRPVASNLNFVKGQVIANAVVARVGAGGYVTVYTSSTSNLIADVSGYWTS